MLPELRKMDIGLILAHQHLHQLNQDVLRAVLGNAGTLITFRVSARGDPMIARELQPEKVSGICSTSQIGASTPG